MLIGTESPAFLLAAPSTAEKLLDALFDDTFAGVHSLAAFDYLILIPYFLMLLVLSFYGCHRFAMIRGYFKGLKNMPKEPAQRFTQLPKVTIQLPLFNERFVVERLLESASRVRYPEGLLQIQVLDDSTDDTAPFTKELVDSYIERGFNMEYRHRSNRQGYKAGALQAGLATATGELMAIFDADFVIPEDFLENTVHYFTDEKVGVVQTRWSYLNRHYNLLTEVQTMLLDGHFILEHGARAGTGLFFNFNGTAGIMRKSMVEDAGGWQHDTLTEDSDLSYRAQIRGWRFVYLPHVHCPSELPVETYSFQVQQSRWAKGLTQCAKKLLKMILSKDLPFRVKLEAFCHLTPNISYPMMILVSALMLPVMIIRFYMGPLEMLLLDFPLIIANFVSLTAFYLIAQRELDPKGWKRTIWFMPALMAAGVALTISNTKAVLEALFNVQTSFARTAKYNLSDKKIKVDQAEYRRKSGWLPFLEIAMGSAFLAMVYYCIESLNFLSIPFLMIFVSGYYWAGFSTLWQEYQGLLQFRAATKAALEAAPQQINR
ncbi:glycosyltransferase [Bryobacter aggregatus]|uniref:glycosyltransferase n=1 Tax=Bryobacter aggregatus TaxID=360054 RepID=UPI00068AB300|nr:glycosyltransferase [Bryobacter aggregatus]